nr:hypothetical protein [Tanacetum cinerariifolium]
MYPSMKFDSSAGDSSFESSDGSSCKRCGSPTATTILSIHATRALVLSRTDLLLPHKRFMDSISPEDSVEEDINTDVYTMKVGVDVATGIDIPDGMLMPDAVERLEQRELEARSLIAGRERASLLEQVESLERSNARLQGTVMRESARADRLVVELVGSISISVNQIPHYGLNNMTITRFGMTLKAIEELVYQRVEEALDAYEATRAANALEAKNQSQNGSNNDNGNDGDRNGRDGNGGNGNPNEDNRGARPVAREYTYQDFMKCQPLKFKGTKGVVRTIRADAAFAMSWRELMKLMAEVFQELTMMCTKMVPEEEDRAEEFI